jgi:N-acetylglutamate synthase-like GNAT family acetyltransferase
MSGSPIVKKVIRYEVAGRVYKTEEEAENAKIVEVAKDIIGKTSLHVYDEDKALTLLASLVTMKMTTKKKIQQLIVALESLEGETKTLDAVL